MHAKHEQTRLDGPRPGAPGHEAPSHKAPSPEAPRPAAPELAVPTLDGSRPGPPRLGGIEALRGVAASAVVLYHAARHVDKAYGAPALAHAFGTGHAGVDLFFVLSGFIILYVHARDIGRPARLFAYASRRFSRVMPLYWVALGATILTIGLAGHGLPPPTRVLTSAILLPANVEPVLGVAWTLQYEIVFYGVFAALILSRPAGLGLLAAWLAWVLVLGFEGAATSPGTIVPTSLYSAYNLQFFFGMAAAYLAMHHRFARPGWLIAAGSLLFAASMLAEFAGALNGYGEWARWSYGIPAALLILGLVAHERCASLAVPAALRRLGAASYAIYLFHFLFIGAAWQAMVRTGLAAHLPRLLCFALLAGAGLGGGWAVHGVIEQPLLRVVRGRGYQKKTGGDEPSPPDPRHL